nr:MAG: Large polyvalent protein-associated domain 13 [Bacteriophage sp.]
MKNTSGFMDSNIKHLYDTMISRGYTGLGDFSNFEGKMKDSGKRKLVYDHLMQDDYFSEIGDFSKFESALGYSPAERKDYVSQSRANPAPIALRQEADVPMKDQSEYVNPWTNSPDYNFESLRKKGKIETATPPPPTEYEKDSSFMNSWVADFIQRTGGQGLNLLGGGFGFLDKAAKDVSNMGLGTYGGMFGDSAKLLKEAGQKLMDKGDRHKEKSFTDLWKEGDYTGSISNLFMEGGSMIIPQITAAMATGGTSAAGLMGASVYSDKLDQLDESNPDMPELAKRVNAISTSAFELLSEKLSLGPAVKWLKGVYNSKGKDVAQKELAGAIENMLGKAYKDAGLLFAPVWEGVTEAASQIAENITDKVTGADPDKNISDGVFEAFGYGVAGGAPIGLIGYGKNKYDNYKYNKMSSPEPSTNSSKTDQGVNTTPQFTKSIIDDAFEQGRNMSDKGDLRDLSLQMEASRTALTEKNPNLAIRMEQYIDNGASENQINEMLKGVDNETRELAYDFYINTQKIKGVEDKSIENINNEVDSYMSDNIIPYVSISPNGRQVISTATFKEGLENKKVYIRSINGDNVIISDNGNNRMVPMSSLSDIEENDVEQIRNSYRQQLLVTRQSELDMAMNHNPKTQLPKPGLVIWNGDNAFILQGQDENGDWIAQPAALDKETGQVAPKAGSAPAMPITERDILALQDAMYDAQQANEVSQDIDNVASVDSDITSVSPVSDTITLPTSEIETEGAIDQIAQPSNVEAPSMVMREDGTPDFVSSGTDMTLDFLYNKYGDKMPRKIEVTRKSFDESLKKASDALEKAQEAYDDAPIGKEDKAEAALIKARQEYEAIKVEADFWANLDDDIKEASKKPGDVIAKEVSVMGDPMSGEELAAMMLANGSIKLTRDSYKKETGAGNNETARMFGLFASPEKGGVNIERAGEILELADKENGTNFFDENDTNAGRDAIIEVLSSARTRGDLIDYVKRNREAIAERERQAEYNDYAEWCEENYHMSPEEYEAYEDDLRKQAEIVTEETIEYVNGEIAYEIQAIINEQNEIDAILAQNNESNEEIERNDEGGTGGLLEGGDQLLQGEQPIQVGRTGETEQGFAGVDDRVDRTDGATQEGAPEEVDRQGNPIDSEGNLIIEDVSSVSDITDEDFINPKRSIGLPPIPQNVSEAIASDGKKVIIKRNIFEKNAKKHAFDPQSSRDILEAALYNTDIVGQSQPLTRKNHWVAIKLDDKSPIVVLEVNHNKDNVEIVGWYTLDNRNLDRIKRQAEREGGELLILTPKGAAASLSTLPDNSSSTDKGSISSSENQANEAKSFVAPSPNENENPLDYAERIVEAKRLFDEELKVNTNPSEAQKEAGNYKKGHIKINGFDVSIEQPVGSVRSGKDASGKEWSQVMNNTYGYIRGTESVDGDHIDVFLGPDMNSDMVYVVDQVNTDGSFDEHKVMMGFSSLEDARSAYLSNYEEGWQGLGNITGVALDEFKKWIDSSTRKTKPFSEYRSVDFIEEERPDSGIRFRETRIIPEEENIIKKAKSDGSYMKAPNGNPTNLNEKQWVQVRTKAFNEWFGDWENNPEDASKVIDENGEPRVVYHGTYADFNAFDESHLGDVTDLNATNDDWAKTSHIGFWFNDNKIGFYTKHKPVFLNVRNPLEFASMESLVDEMSYYDSEEDFKRSNSDGYDSVIVLEDEEMGGRSYSVFNDNQIKSATENNGGFSSYNDDIRFREVKDKNGEKSLVGLHNISEEKLLKALRQGGFANPSAAIIDISRQSHTGYGSISLVLPSSMVEKRTGKNAGTWSQDAWTPIYPTIERQFSGKGSDVFSKDLQKLPEEMRSTTKSGMDSYMDGRGEDSLAYMYLYEQGKAPEIARTKPSYPEKTRTEVEDATNGSFSMSGLSDKQLSRLKDAYMEYKGFSTEGYNEAIKLRRAKLEEAIGKMNPRSILYEKRKTDLERIDKYGFDYSAVESFMKSVRDDISNSDKVDAHGTMRDSWNFIEENGMRGDFNKWLDKLNERYGIKEIIFNGFTPSGIRKYIPNTLENVSKFMKKQGRSASVGIGASFQNFAASLLDAKGSLKDIRKDKGKLTTDHADVDAFRDKWSKVFHELGEKLQPDAKGYDDYGLYRLAEAARSKDPQKYIKEEYGIDFSDEDVKTLNEMVDAIRNEYPAMYFETKFERPVYLEEFAAAVVPDNVDGDIRKAIYDAGLKIFTYKADDEISRNEAVKQASEIDGVRFRSIGEKGAANLNKAETIESSINDWSNKLNTPVRVIHDVDDITDTNENMLARKRDSKGWYDTSTGEIVIVSPNSTSVGDAQRTFLHEVVGHHGLRELFGDDFDTFLDNVYRNANEDIRKNIIDRTKGNPLNLREATEEYLAELAERGFDNKVDRSLWEKIKDAFLDMLRKAGISLDFKLSDNDLRYILWRSYKNLEQGNLMDVAEDTVMRNDLGVGDFSVRFREAKTEVENEEPLNKEMVDAWDKVASSDSFKFKEAMVDSLTAIDEFLKLLAKKTKSKILDYENPYYALIALSSKNKADMDSFDSKFLNPLNEAIRALIGDVSEVSKKGLRRTWDWSKGPLRDLVKYVQSKHGIERNRDMSVRDGIETLKAFDVDALSKMGVISDSDLKNAKKTAEKVAEEKGSEAYKKTYDKVLGKELKKGVDKDKAERSAEIAADYRKSFVKSEIYNKEMDKYKEKVTGTLIDRWEDSKKDVLNKDLAWDEEQKELDREALSFQWKLGDNSYGVILGKDYSGLSSVFKSSEDGANKDKWLSDAYDFVRDYESTHNMVLVDNLWDKVHNVSEYTLRRQYESGLINKSYMDKNLSRFKYFIPLRGFSDNIASDVYDYIDATEIKMGNPVKTAKGRISEADNPFAGLIHVGYGSITAGNRNLAKQRFLNLASNHDTGGLITIDNIWVRNVGTEENPEWVESIPQIPDNASGEEVAKAVKDHEEMMRELREEGKAELIKGGRSDIPYKTLYDQRSQHQVQVFVGGNRYVMTVNGNPRLAQAVNGLTNPDVKDDLAYVVARNLKTFMAGAFTSKNVAFSFANLIRDTPYANNSVFVTENFRYFKDFSGNQRRALFGLRSLGRNLYKYRRGEIDISDKEQAIFKEFMDNGGATGYTFVETQKEYAKDLANKLEKLSDGNIGKLSPKELVSTVFECFEFMGNVAELVNRYAAYKTSREHGRSIDRSINDAKEVSVNFNKKGAGKKTKSDKWYINTAAWISEYGRDWVLFFNAAVQSMYKEYSMLRNHPIKGIGSRIAPLIFMGSSVSLLNNLFMPMLFAYLGWDSDDDDRDYFDSLSDHERQNNICIRLTHGRWLKIPLSPELANYFKIGDIIAGQLSGKREVEAMDVVKTGIDMVSPLNINWEYDSWKFALNLLPTVVQPIAQNASNVNFMGNPIYKTSMNKANDYDPEYTKVYRNTSTTMVELSRALNSLTGGDDVKRGTSFNPATWQNILSGYTGGFGTVALGVSDLVLDMLSGENGDMPVSRYPLLSRFLTGGDKDLKLSRMNSIYNKKVVDFVSEMDHDYKGYLEKSMDPSINILDRAEYIVKLEKFMKSDDFKKSQELSQYVRAISDMERFLREVGSDNDSLENQVYELKLRALEIFEDSDE